jgi:phosphopantetheinyl transferase (holo-ACP synthase)
MDAPWLSVAEKTRIQESADPERSFIQLWTRKEAAWKAYGKGLSQELIEDTAFLDFLAGYQTLPVPLDAGHEAAVCLRGGITFPLSPHPRADAGHIGL